MNLQLLSSAARIELAFSVWESKQGHKLGYPKILIKAKIRGSILTDQSIWALQGRLIL
jgi:hypothetical protein